MGKSYYLSDLEMEILSRIMMRENGKCDWEKENKESEAINKLALKLYEWNEALK